MEMYTILYYDNKGFLWNKSPLPKDQLIDVVIQLTDAGFRSINIIKNDH